jgi:uncharacterized repeat protein (TIGR03806 family)
VGCSGTDKNGGHGTSPAVTNGPQLPAGVEPPPERAEFGLDTRPTNTTCRAPARPPAAGPLKIERVFPNLKFTSLMAIAQPPGDRSRWFAIERAGKLYSFSSDNPAAPQLLVDVPAITGKPIMTDLEAGLLNLAFHPKFAQNGRLFVSFVTTGTPLGYASEVGYLHTPDNGKTFDSYTTVFRFDRDKLYHCGGGMAFGNEGYLYLGFGDGANHNNGQKKSGFFAKIHRIDVDNVPAGKMHGIPKDNPFVNDSEYEPSVFARGIRNPFRLTIDRETNDLWVGDVGQENWEEVNRVQAGKNYGWGCREGAQPYPARTADTCPANPGELIDPVYTYEHAGPGYTGRSVTGGFVYRGKAMQELQGTYIFADYIKEEIYTLVTDRQTGEVKVTKINEGGPNALFTNFAQDADGELFASSVHDSSIYKLVPSNPNAVSTFPDKLSKTGCMDTNALVPYGVNVELWSDGAGKDRFIALPEGAKIHANDDGDLDLPVGSVVIKNFGLQDKKVETRLLVHHDDGEWAGYTYEWNDEQTDADLLYSGKTKTIGDQSWTFPSRSDCVRCHTTAAGRTLGLELGQLNGDFVYAKNRRISNQLTTLEHIGIFDAPLKPANETVSYPPAFGEAPAEARARSYLHANCSMCHRPNGGAGRAAMDLRFGTSFHDTKSCGATPIVDDLGMADSKLIAPGKPQSSVVSIRIHSTDAKRMPPLASRRVDDKGVQLIDTWISSMNACP